MSFFIEKIFRGDGVGDSLVHLQFQKFGKGNFPWRAMIIVKKSKEKYSVNTGPEYANEFVRFLAKKLGDGKAEIKGVIISTLDLSGKISFEDKKQFQGVKKYFINSEMTGHSLLALCEEIPTSFMGLSFKVGDTELKIKQKAPKSGKPSGKEGEKPAVDFCKLKTNDKELIRSLLFDINLDSFKKAEIEHDFIIDDIAIDYKIKDPKEMREKAIRKGKIVRNIDVDGKLSKKEAFLEA